MEDLLKLVEPLLGSCRVVADHSWPKWREATVAEVIDSADVRWLVKRHCGAERYGARDSMTIWVADSAPPVRLERWT